MIKAIIRVLLFTAISVKISQYIIGGFEFRSAASVILYILGLSVLYNFEQRILALLSLPSRGPGFLFISFILTLITTYVLTLFIPQFFIRSTVVSELIIFGFMLPSKRLSVVWSAVFSSLLIAVLMFFFKWLCEEKKK